MAERPATAAAAADGRGPGSVSFSLAAACEERAQRPDTGPGKVAEEACAGREYLFSAIHGTPQPSTAASISSSSSRPPWCTAAWSHVHRAPLKRRLDPVHVPEPVGLVQPSWLPYASHPPPTPPSTAPPLRQGGGRSKPCRWSTRHHICDSKDNRRLPRFQRAYFDDLPQTCSHGGEYRAVLGHRSRNFDHFCLAPTRDQHRDLHRRFRRYPFVEAARAAQDGEALRLPGGVAGAASGSASSAAAGQVGALGNGGGTPPAVGDVSACQSGGGPVQTNGRPSSGLAEQHAAEPESVGSRPRLVRSTPRTASSPKGRCSLPRRTSPKLLGQQGILLQFYAWCDAKFGGVVRLWRCLDVHNNMRVGQGQFLKKLRELQYNNDAKELFRVLNRDQTGTLLFYHFAPEAALKVAELLHWARCNYGGLKGIGLMSACEQSGRITRNQFFALLKKKGFANEEAMMSAFELVDEDGNGNVSRSEAMLLDNWDFPEWLAVQPDQQAAHACKAAMLAKCQGNALLAWRHLDRNGMMRISWHDFRQVCRKLLSVEDCQKMPSAWRALDDDLSGWLSLREFDSDTHTMLVKFCQWAIETFGSVMAAFPKLAASDAKISKIEFRSTCNPCGLGDANVSSMFVGLDTDGTGTISAAEIRFLDQWKPAGDINEGEVGDGVQQEVVAPHQHNTRHSHAAASIRTLRAKTLHHVL